MEDEYLASTQITIIQLEMRYLMHTALANNVNRNEGIERKWAQTWHTESTYLGAISSHVGEESFIFAISFTFVVTACSVGIIAVYEPK